MCLIVHHCNNILGRIYIKVSNCKKSKNGLVLDCRNRWHVFYCYDSKSIFIACEMLKKWKTLYTQNNWLWEWVRNKTTFSFIECITHKCDKSNELRMYVSNNTNNQQSNRKSQSTKIPQANISMEATKWTILRNSRFIVSTSHIKTKENVNIHCLLQHAKKKCSEFITTTVMVLKNLLEW